MAVYVRIQENDEESNDYEIPESSRYNRRDLVFRRDGAPVRTARRRA